MADEAPARKTSPAVAIAVVGAFVVGVIVGHSSSGGSSSSASTPSYSYAQAPNAAPQPTADPSVTGQYTAGTYTVGTDIQPGTYTTPGQGTNMCYWQRSRDAAGTLQSIIANDNVTGRGVMTVASSDKFVTFRGECTWARK